MSGKSYYKWKQKIFGSNFLYVMIFLKRCIFSYQFQLYVIIFWGQSISFKNLKNVKIWTYFLCFLLWFSSCQTICQVNWNDNDFYKYLNLRKYKLPRRINYHKAINVDVFTCFLINSYFILKNIFNDAVILLTELIQ